MIGYIVINDNELKQYQINHQEILDNDSIQGHSFYQIFDDLLSQKHINLIDDYCFAIVESLDVPVWDLGKKLYSQKLKIKEVITTEQLLQLLNV